MVSLARGTSVPLLDIMISPLADPSAGQQQAGVSSWAVRKGLQSALGGGELGSWQSLAALASQSEHLLLAAAAVLGCGADSSLELSQCY